MNQSIFKNAMLALVPVLILSFAACKEEKNDDPVTPAKTLNKSTLTPNSWVNEAGNIQHVFKAGGVYSATGSWKWVNNSDTMEIVMSQGEDAILWKFYWNTDTQMKCRWINNNEDMIFNKK